MSLLWPYVSMKWVTGLSEVSGEATPRPWLQGTQHTARAMVTLMSANLIMPPTQHDRHTASRHQHHTQGPSQAFTGLEDLEMKEGLKAGGTGVVGRWVTPMSAVSLCGLKKCQFASTFI